ncbi:MAG: hypothetical protein U0599_16755 [Vicinamibacteria bacterium]
MTGGRVQAGMVCGSTDHSATLPVVFAASSERTTYQPFCARFRPSAAQALPRASGS